MFLLHKLTQGKVLKTGLSLVALVIISSFFARSYRYLSPNKPAASDILVVEGWLDEQSLLQTRDIFYHDGYSSLITTGVRNANGYEMGSGGKAVFALNNLFIDSVPDLYQISLTHRGTSVNGIFPRFRIWIDSMEVAASYSKKKVTEYSCQAAITKAARDITIVFDNDEVSAWRDRNFYFYTLTVNNRVFHPGNCVVSYYIGSGSTYYFKKQYMPDVANDAMQYLAMNGIPVSSMFPVVTVKQVKFSKTFSTAVDVRSYLEGIYPDGIPPVTIVTRGIHARRTWVSYKKAFGKQVDIGIISLPDDELTPSNWWKSPGGWKSMVYEITGLIYATVIL